MHSSSCHTSHTPRKFLLKLKIRYILSLQTERYVGKLTQRKTKELRRLAKCRHRREYNTKVDTKDIKEQRIGTGPKLPAQ